MRYEDFDTIEVGDVIGIQGYPSSTHTVTSIQKYSGQLYGYEGKGEDNFVNYVKRQDGDAVIGRLYFIKKDGGEGE